MRVPLGLALAAIALLHAAPAEAARVLHLKGDGRTVERSERHLPPARLPVAPRAVARSRPPARVAGSGSRRVKRALRDALEAGQIDAERHRSWRRVLRAAQRTRARLSGARRAQMSAQLGTLYTIARRGLLTAGRMPALFLQLERNTEYWPAGAFPASGGRVTFEGSELIFQYYSGRGLQLQPLANFGKANGLWRAGRADELRLLLDELAAIASPRGRFVTWEYWFSFGGGSPPWMSAMAHGTAMQALTRGAELLGERRYRRLARRGVRAFSTRWPVGTRVRGRDGGNHYLIYSFSRGLRVLNAFTQALNGLYDYASATGHGRAMRLFEKGELSLRGELADYDTGAWSRYSLGGAEASTNYHGLATDFLGNLCERLGPGPHCDAATRFEGYTSESPRLAILTSRLKAGNRQYVRFTLSKRSTVTMTISRGGAVVHTATLAMPFGTRSFAWTPPEPGDYTVSLAAASFHGTQGAAAGAIAVR